jgi:hypothetical protein
MVRALIFLCCVSLTTLFGQGYEPFPSSAAIWTEIAVPKPPEQVNTYNRYGYQHLLMGDTVLNEQTYQLIYYRNAWMVHRYPVYIEGEGYVYGYENINIEEPPRLLGALRQDTAARQVFFLRLMAEEEQDVYSVALYEAPLGEEILLYDFSLQPGDSAQLPEEDQVEEIVEVALLDGSTRSGYRFNPAGFRWWVQGIGGTYGLFDPLIFEYHESGNFLVCFSQGGTVVYDNQGMQMVDSDDLAENCGTLLTSQSTITATPQMVIAPNPFRHSFTVNYPGESGRFLLFNALGQPVGEWPLQQGEQSLTPRIQAPGWYFYQIEENGQLMQRGTLLKGG